MKKVPVGIIILGILWMLSGLIVAYRSFLLKTYADNQGILMVLFFMGIGFISMGISLIAGYNIIRITAISLASFSILLNVILLILMPANPQEYNRLQQAQKQQFKEYLEQRQMLEIEEIGVYPQPGIRQLRLTVERFIILAQIIFAVISIFYLNSAGVKEFFGIETRKGVYFK